jgi:hypothetical protein
MSELVEFPLVGGGSFVVVSERNSSREPAAKGGQVFRGGGDRREVVTRSTETMEAAISRVRPAAIALAESFSDLPARPQEVSVTFGIELSAELGAVIASTSMSANFSVTLTWNHPGDDKP